MIQEGHMKDFECILGDSEILAEQLLWSLSPVCGGPANQVTKVILEKSFTVQVYMFNIR